MCCVDHRFWTAAQQEPKGTALKGLACFTAFAGGNAARDWSSANQRSDRSGPCGSLISSSIASQAGVRNKSPAAGPLKAGPAAATALPHQLKELPCFPSWNGVGTTCLAGDSASPGFYGSVQGGDTSGAVLALRLARQFKLHLKIDPFFGVAHPLG